MKRFFTGMQIFHLPQPPELTAVKLHEMLEQSKFKPAGDLERSSMGWVPPIEGLDTLTLPVSDTIFFTARKQTKILPTSVIKDFVHDRIEAIKTNQLRNVGKREKKEITDDVIVELLPRALPRNVNTTAYIDIKNHWLVVNTPSRNTAEEIVSLLRLDLKDFPAIPPSSDEIPLFLTQWLATRDLPAGFTMGFDCKLIDEDNESVTCRQLDLLSKEVNSLVSNGRAVEYLALNWKDKLSFVLDDEFGIRSVKFLDAADSDSKNDGDVQSDLFVMVATFAQFIPQLLNAAKPIDHPTPAGDA